MANDEATVLARVVEIAQLQDADDGVERTETTTARTIRDEALYAGLRVVIGGRVSENVDDTTAPPPHLVEASARVRHPSLRLHVFVADGVTTTLEVPRRDLRPSAVTLHDARRGHLVIATAAPTCFKPINSDMIAACHGERPYKYSARLRVSSGA